MTNSELGVIKTIYFMMRSNMDKGMNAKMVLKETCKSIEIINRIIEFEDNNRIEKLAHYMLTEYEKLLASEGNVNKGNIAFLDKLKKTIMDNSSMTEADIEKELHKTYNDTDKLDDIIASDLKEFISNYLGDIIPKGTDEYNEITINPIVGERKREIKEFLNKNKPTDRITVSDNMLTKLSCFWDKECSVTLNRVQYIPADILWANTIPLRDCIIDVPLTPQEMNNKNAMKGVRVTVTEDTSLPISHICGYVTLMLNSGDMITATFGVRNPEDEDSYKIMIPSDIAYIEAYNNQIIREFEENPENVWNYYMRKDLLLTIYDYLQVWYGIQVALLNPQIKEVFEKHSSMSVITETKKKNNKKKGNSSVTKIKYVKRYVISDDIFNEAMERSYIRTKLCWYVTGHWRNQAVKEGHKRIFIQGYWKGVARETKAAESRSRDIAFNNDKKSTLLKFVHYGHDHFDINKFIPIENDPKMNKPLYGLWASPVDANFGWLDWCDKNGFCFKQDKQFAFTLQKDAKILIIENKRDVFELDRKYIYCDEDTKKFIINYEALEEDGYQAIYYEYSPDVTNTVMNGWECDSLLVMDPSIIEPI